MQILTHLLLILPAATALWGSSSTFDDDDALKVPGANPLKFCEDPVAASHILRISNVDLSPNPPEAGQVLSIVATGNFTKEVVEGSYVNIVVKLGPITLIKRREDLCEQIKQVDRECPLQEGETTVTKDVELPKIIPPGKFTVLADVLTKDEKMITCLRTEIQFSRKGASTQKKLSGDDDLAIDL